MEPMKVTPRLASLVDLPTELLLHIFRRISVKDLYHLSLLCRRLHHVALPLHLNCYGIEDFQTLKFTTGGRSMSGLRGLRIATFLESISHIYYAAGDPGDPKVILGALHELTRLISTPSITCVESMTLDFTHIGFWKRSKVGMVQMHTKAFEVWTWNEV